MTESHRQPVYVANSPNWSIRETIDQFGRLHGKEVRRLMDGSFHFVGENTRYRATLYAVEGGYVFGIYIDNDDVGG